MRMKLICLAILAALCFLAATAGGDQTKSYRLTLSSAFQVGNAELQPGEYTLVIDQPKVRFVELKTGKSVEMEAKVLSTDEKNSSTAIHSERVDGGSRIREIRIGGSKIRVAFD